MTRKPIRAVTLFGLFGARNIGNEATLAATLHALRQRMPRAQFSLVSSPLDPTAALDDRLPRHEPDMLPVARYVRGVSPLELRETCRTLLHHVTEPVRIRRTRAKAKDMDLLLVPGTGIADDFGQGPLDIPHHLRRWCSAARERGAVVRFASIGAGPVEHPLSRRWFREALEFADYRSYREHSSKQFALEVGVPAEDDPVLPDLVFSLPLRAGLTERRVNWPPKVVGIGIMGYYGWNAPAEAREGIYTAYLQKLSGLVAELLRRGYRVRLLAGSRGVDRRPIADLSQAHGQRGLIAQPIQSYVDLLEEIAATDVVIATRFHNVLLSLMLERPAISIGYASKNDDLMVEMGLGEYCHSIDTFDPEAVMAQFEHLVARSEPPLDVARARAAEYREQLNQQYDELLRV